MAARKFLSLIKNKNGGESLKRALVIAVSVVAIVLVILVAFLLIPRGPNIEVWVAKTEFGSPATEFLNTDGIYPVVQSSADLGDKRVKVSLIDANDNTLMEKTFNIPKGTTGYGDYNPTRNLARGSYHMEFWYDTTLLKTIQITVE
jgi:hypothetical protein